LGTVECIIDVQPQFWGIIALQKTAIHKNKSQSIDEFRVALVLGTRCWKMLKPHVSWAF
jgi:hypothetical protein